MATAADSSVPARKRRLRAEIRARVLAMDPLERRLQEAWLRSRLPELPGFREAQTVLLYAPAFAEELDLWTSLREVAGRGQQLVLPRFVRGSRDLVLHAVAHLDRDLVAGVFGILEPGSACPIVAPHVVDWALVPGLGFSPQGYRLGRGAGCYDRLLPQLRPDCPRWALAFESQWEEELPVELHDQPLDGIVSPSREVRIARLGPDGPFLAD